jgi:hypothetical protein
MVGNRFATAFVLLCVMLLFAVGCQSESNSAEPQLDPAEAATQTRQSEIIAVLTNQAMTPRATRRPLNFGAVLPSNLTDTPTPQVEATGTLTPTATPRPRTILLEIPFSAETNVPIASQATITSPSNQTIEISLQHDGETLFVIFSGLEAGNLAVFPELIIDPQNDSGQAIDEDDRWFHYSTASCMGQGAGFLWQSCGEPEDWSVKADLADEGVAEFAIPFATLGIDPARDRVIGVLPGLFYLDQNGTEQRIYWPDSAEIDRPVTWAGATLGN